jgi:predicted site-specific integrase-resolvase
MVLTDDGGLYDMQSLANRLKVRRHKVREWRDTGKIPPPIIRDGNRCYWSQEQIDMWLSSGVFVQTPCNTNDKPN